jgi:flagellar hook-basal body protein
MALIRALNTAIAGLRSQQFRIDTIGDNLANSTTTGFKASRVNFENALTQTLSFGTAPQGFLGGIDPEQIGLGVTVASTTRNFTQGELEITGRASDLAIDGAGFFILRDAQGSSTFTRDGSFTINPANLLRYDGVSWAADMAKPGFDVFGLKAMAADDIYAVGASSRIAHWNGSAWSTVTDLGPSVTQLNQIRGTTQCDLWVVGAGGVVATTNP